MKRLVWQVLPPLLLLVLVFIPVDVITILAWGVGAIAALVSVFTLARKVVAWLRTRRPDWMLAIRPALTIVLFAVVTIVNRGKVSEEAQAADEVARAAAGEVQAACKRDAKCPAAPAGWSLDADTGRALKVVGRIPMRYDRSRDGAEFRVSVRHELEMALDIHGGVAKELREQRVIR